MSGVGFDLAPDPHDPQIDGPVECLGVAGIGQFQQAIPGQHPLGIGGEHLQQAVFGSRQGMLIALIVA